MKLIFQKYKNKKPPVHLKGVSPRRELYRFPELWSSIDKKVERAFELKRCTNKSLPWGELKWSKKIGQPCIHATRKNIIINKNRLCDFKKIQLFVLNRDDPGFLQIILIAIRHPISLRNAFPLLLPIRIGLEHDKAFANRYPENSPETLFRGEKMTPLSP